MASSLAVQPLVTVTAAAATARRVTRTARASRQDASRKTKIISPALSASASSAASSSSVASSRRRVVAQAQSTESAVAADPEGDAADGITPGFGAGSPLWPLIHADLKNGTFGKVRTVGGL
jgi:hypothetical protein